MSDSGKYMAYGRRFGHLSTTPFKLFAPYGSNRIYKYDKSVVPSIAASERVYDNRAGLTPRAVHNYATGDNNYYDDLLSHYQRIPKKYWNNINTAWFNKNSATMYGDTVIPVVTQGDQSPSFRFAEELPPYKYDAYITMPSGPGNWYLTRNLWTDPLPTFAGKPYGINSTNVSAVADTSTKGLLGSSLAHEFFHTKDAYGGRIRNKNKGTYSIAKTGPNMTPVTDPGIDIRPTAESMLYDDIQHGSPAYFKDIIKAYRPDNTKGRLKPQASSLDPYDIADLELRQSITSYNRNRYLLANNIRKNFSHYHLRYGFNPLKLAMVTAQPKFYTPDFKGRQQFIRDMDFYSKNPEIAELLGNEGRRGVSSYYNIQRERNAVNKQDSALNNLYNRLVGYRVL